MKKKTRITNLKQETINNNIWVLTIIQALNMWLAMTHNALKIFFLLLTWAKNSL